MVKHFCDWCGKEITGESILLINPYNIEKIESLEYCYFCKREVVRDRLEILTNAFSVKYDKTTFDFQDYIYDQLSRVCRAVCDELYKKEMEIKKKEG